MRKFCLLLLLLAFECGFAQDKAYVDSLLVVLKTTHRDTARAELLYELSKAYWGNNPQQALNYARQTLGLSRRIAYGRGIANAYNSIGWVTGQQGNFVQAIAMHRSALRIYRQIRYNRGIGFSYNNIGEFYRMQGKYAEALQNHFASLKVKESIGDEYGIAMSYNNIGIIYHLQGNYDAAITNYEAALKIRKKIGDVYGLGATLSNIGSFYQDKKNFAEALRYYKKALEIVTQIADKDGIAHSFTDIGALYAQQQKYDEALQNNLQALRIRREIGDENGIATSYNSIGENYLKLKNFSEADHYLREGLLLSQKLGSLEEAKNSHKALSELGSARADYKTALADYKSYIAIRDSLVNSENIQKAVQLQLQYNLEKREREAKIERARLLEISRRHQNIQYALIAVGILSFIVVFLLLSHTIIVSRKIIEFFGVITLLVVFEFFNLLLHPLIEKITHHSTLLMLLALVCVASMLVPLHHKIEKWATGMLIAKNKRIHLARLEKARQRAAPEDEMLSDEEIQPSNAPL